MVGYISMCISTPLCVMYVRFVDIVFVVCIHTCVCMCDSPPRKPVHSPLPFSVISKLPICFLRLIHRTQRSFTITFTKYIVTNSVPITLVLAVPVLVTSAIPTQLTFGLGPDRLLLCLNCFFWVSYRCDSIRDGILVSSCYSCGLISTECSKASAFIVEFYFFTF